MSSGSKSLAVNNLECLICYKTKQKRSLSGLNSEFSFFFKKNDLVSYPAWAEGLGKYDKTKRNQTKPIDNKWF